MIRHNNYTVTYHEDGKTIKNFTEYLRKHVSCLAPYQFYNSSFLSKFKVAWFFVSLMLLISNCCIAMNDLLQSNVSKDNL